MSRKPIECKVGLRVVLSNDDKLRAKVHAIFKMNGISPLTNSTCDFKQWNCVETISNEGLYQGSNLDGSFGRTVSTEEFIAEYGEKEDVFNGPELVGPIIPLNGKFYRAVSKEKGWMSEDGIPCLAGNGESLLSICHVCDATLFVVLPKKTRSQNPIRTLSSVFDYAWLEVPAPEVLPIKEYTQEELVILVGHEFKLKVMQ